MDSILELKDISYSYHNIEGETKAIEQISFSVKKGEFIAIVGPSGCGKSTLLHLIADLEPPQKGSILKKTSTIGYMLQRDELLEWRSIYRNILLGLEIRHMVTAKTKEKIQKMLLDYGLNDFTDAKPSELSGGMRQRAALIRTLVLDPDILLLDEPFSALDYQTRLNVSNDIGQIIRKEKKTALLVTHDLSEAISLADRILILSKRPSTLKQTIALAFENADMSPMERRNSPKFKTYFNLIWKELNSDDRDFERTNPVS